MPPNRFESEVESFLEGSHGDRTHIKRADHHTVTPLCGTLLPAAAHGRHSQALLPPTGATARPCCRPRAPQPGRCGYCASSTFACNSPVTISVFELASVELQRFWALLKVHAIELHAEFLVCVTVVTRGQWSLVQRRPRMLRIRIGCCNLDRL